MKNQDNILKIPLPIMVVGSLQGSKKIRGVMLSPKKKKHVYSIKLYLTRVDEERKEK